MSDPTIKLERDEQGNWRPAEVTAPIGEVPTDGRTVVLPTGATSAPSAPSTPAGAPVASAAASSAPLWGAGAPSAAVKASPPVAAAVAAGGALLTAISTPMTWAKRDGFEVGGFDFGSGYALLIALIIGALAVWALVKKTRLASEVVLVAAVVLVLTAIVDFIDIPDGVSAGLGLWLAIVGGIVCIVGAVLARAMPGENG